MIRNDYIEIRASGCPWMLLVTPDPEATIEALADADVPGLDSPAVITWTLAGGVKRLKGTPAAVPRGLADGAQVNKPFPVLKEADTLKPGSVLFFRIPSSEFWRSDACVSAMQALRAPFKSTSRTLVLVAQPGAGDRLPPQLDADVPVLREELPSEEELRALATELVSDNGIDAAGEDIRIAVSSLRGMTLFAAENALARKGLTGRLLSGELAEVRRESVEASTGGGLMFERATTTFDDVGGLNAVKDFMTRLFAGPEAPDLVVRIDEIDKVIGANAVGAVADNTGISQDMLRVLLTEIEDNGWLFGIFAGCPGAGKSYVTTAIGNTFKRLTMAADLAKCRASLVGASEAALRQVMSTIKALGGRKVLVLATANRMETLPPELLSRAGTCGIWYFDAPSKAQRRGIWNVQLAVHGRELDEPLPDDRGWVGRDIRNCCRLANILGCALTEAAPYTMKTGVVSLDLINDSRAEAEACGYLDAETPGPYIRKVEREQEMADAQPRRTINIVPVGGGPVGDA